MKFISCVLLFPFLASHAEMGVSVEAVGGWGVDFAVPRSHHPENGLDGIAASDRSTGPLFGLGLESTWSLPCEARIGMAAEYLVRTTSWNLDGSQILSENSTDSVKYALQEDGSETFQFLGAGPCLALPSRRWVGFRILAELGGVHGAFRDHWESRDSGRSTPLRASDRSGSGSGWVPGYQIGAELEKSLNHDAGIRLGLRYAGLLGTLSNGTDTWSAKTRNWQRFDAVLGGYFQF